MSGFIFGFFAFFRGLSWIRRKNLWSYMILPCAASFIAGTALIVFYFWLISGLMQAGAGSAVEQMNRWTGSSFSSGDSGTVLINTVSALLSLLMYIFTYRPVAGIAVLPFLGFLLEKLEKIGLGESVQIPMHKEVKNLFLGLIINIKYTVIGVLSFFIGLLFGPFQPFFVGAVQGWILGRGSFDYILEKNTENLKDREKAASNFRMEIFGLGIAQFLFLFIPIIGVVLGPIAAVIGSFLIYYRDRIKE